MPHRFSNQELYQLRNAIPIRLLIQEDLQLRCRVEGHRLHFACPLCSGYDTAINERTNLARCFHCRRNFNTIDLTMLVRGKGFVPTIQFLKSHQQHCDPPHPTAPQAKGTLQSVRQILRSIATTAVNGATDD